jgi:hypothetical protein
MRTELKVYILIFIAIFAVNRYLHYENDVKLIGSNDCYNRKNLDGVIKELDDKSKKNSINEYGKIFYGDADSLISEMTENENIVYLKDFKEGKRYEDFKEGKLYKVEKEDRYRNGEKILRLSHDSPNDNKIRLKVLTKEGKEIYKYNKLEQYYLTKKDKKRDITVGNFIASLLLQYRCKIKSDK